MHGMEVMLLSVFGGDHLYFQAIPSLMVAMFPCQRLGWWLAWALPNAPGSSGHLVGWGCGPPSGYWFQVSADLGCLIWWPLTWKQWLWIETLDEFIQFGHKGPCKKIGKTNGLAITLSFPQWVVDPFICHQWIPLQMWGHFLPGKRYSPAFSNHQIGNSRNGHKPPQLYTAEPDLWDPATSFWAHPGMQEMWPFLGTLDELGLTKVMTYPVCANLHQTIVVLAALIQGLRDTGWQVTQLTCKQLKQTNSGYPR